MGILARQSWARPVSPASAAKPASCGTCDVQAIARFAALMADWNVHPALAVYNAGDNKPRQNHLCSSKRSRGAGPRLEPNRVCFPGT